MNFFHPFAAISMQDCVSKHAPEVKLFVYYANVDAFILIPYFIIKLLALILSFLAHPQCCLHAHLYGKNMRKSTGTNKTHPANS